MYESQVVVQTSGVDEFGKVVLCECYQEDFLPVDLVLHCLKVLRNIKGFTLLISQILVNIFESPSSLVIESFKDLDLIAGVKIFKPTILLEPLDILINVIISIKVSKIFGGSDPELGRGLD